MSDNNYWEKRAVDLEKLSQDRADVDIMHCLEIRRLEHIWTNCMVQDM